MSSPTVVVLAGIPGAGKTTLARALVTRTGWSRISRDDIRAAMFQPCDFTAAEKASAFQATILALEATLRLGRSCVIEGMPFSRVGELEAVAEATGRHDATLAPFVIGVPVDIAVARAAGESASRPDARDRVPDLVREVAGRMRAFGEGVHRLDGTAATDALLALVLDRVGARAATG